jgi:GTP-dependent phosphoenolpyruvate carboxykinase
VNDLVAQWVESVRQLTTPVRVHWCDRTKAEHAWHPLVYPNTLLASSPTNLP